MTATLFKLHETMSLHKAWRVNLSLNFLLFFFFGSALIPHSQVAFAVVPVPILLLVAIATVVLYLPYTSLFP